MAPMKSRLCIVRHGETPWNAERRLQGHTDIPLNAAGLAQAEATARVLAAHRFAALYTSDLTRAVQTASFSARRLGLTPIAMTELRERHFGQLQGLTYDEARLRHPEAYRRWQSRDPEFAFDSGGESLNAFAARVERAVNRLAQLHLGEQILLVAHGGVLDTINRMVRQLPLTVARDFEIPNAALNWIEFDEGRWRIVAWAMLDHLDGARDELPNT